MKIFRDGAKLVGKTSKDFVKGIEDTEIMMLFVKS